MKLIQIPLKNEKGLGLSVPNTEISIDEKVKWIVESKSKLKEAVGDLVDELVPGVEYRNTTNNLKHYDIVWINRTYLLMKMAGYE